MVLAGDFSMSRTDEVHRITENVYKSIMEQFNPCLRNFVAMGKTYEKALSSVTFAAKGYFDALVRMGELASESHGSKDLGDVLFQMAEVHRQIQVQLEEMLKSFHNELLTELEKKVELDARYLNAALKKYQMEHRSKGESLEKCQAELKRLRRKSQGSKNPSKYSDKEMQGKDLLTQKVPIWQQACSDPTKLPERALILAQQMSCGGGGTLMASPRHSSKGSLHITEPMPGSKPLPVPPELAGHLGGSLGQQTRLMSPDAMPLVNGTAGLHGADYAHWAEEQVAQVKPASPQVQRQAGEVYSNTLPVRRPTPSKSKAAVAENRTLPRSSSMAAGLERNGRTRVQAIFSHAAGDNSTLLSFIEGDIITLLVPEARDGWHYGESEKTKMRGWFPFSYTRLLPETNESDRLHVSLHHGRSSSTGNLLERDDLTLPPPDYGMPSRQLAQPTAHSRQRPYSMAMPGFSQQGMADYESRFPTREVVGDSIRPAISYERSASILY
ncbi:brain-specific angiogenesis inhibitor 1-associated protein 2 isoform X12 [Brienomyrus brachyistius]|uniref:brain-specific angiogenesis inhibitor 1-associated protein 2 isoform X12 n=1 Tax=Brienomyrus brachyistius TaxID=42636 RepID=UPI0020B1D543|nr:brain-specific angiogenesis inhibitor 1-associated protein 2 isoform X12 [Brienomyrus brachyistius]